jgi:hypothetical protein
MAWNLSRSLRRSLGKRSRRLLLGCSVIALGTSGWGDDLPTLASPKPMADAAAPSGITLNGILPEEVPAGLSSDDFADLTGTWEKWGQETANTVQMLFRPHENLDALEVDLANAEIKLGTMEKALNDSKYRQVHGLLADLHGRLRRRVDVAKVILEAQRANVSAAQSKQLNAALGKLQQAVATVEQDVSKFPNGRKWLPYVRADQLKELAREKATSPELLETVKVNLAGRSTLEGEQQREFLHRASFVTLERAIDTVLDASVQRDPNTYLADIQRIGAAMFQALEDYEVRGGELAAQAVRDQYAAWKSVAADGGAAMSEVLRKHYMNFNFRLVAAEGFLKRVFETNRSEGSWVNDCIMEARVTGYQCTDTHLNVDVRPHTGSALFCLVLDGNVRSNTQAVTDQATAHTVGYHRFHAEKATFFDGHDFTASQSTVSVSANNRAVSADTGIRIPIIRGIANSIAFKEVQKRLPQSNAITRQKIMNQVGPRLDSEVIQNFDKAETQLEGKLYGPLRELESYPQELDVNSTEDAVLVRARLMEDIELGGSEWPNVPMPSNGVVIQTHESLLNNSLERANFAGRELTQQELQDELKARMEKLLQRPLEQQKVETAEPTTPPEPTKADEPTRVEDVPAPDEDKTARFVFDEHDAIKFKVTNGTIRLIMRTGLKREGADPIPTQQIEVPLAMTVEGDEIIIRRTGTIAVRPVGPVGNRTEQIVRANVMRSNIARLTPERHLKGTINMKSGNKTIPLKVTDVITRAGWVSIVAR